MVNVGAAWALARAQRQSMNVKGARAHVLTDLYASLGAALAGALVLLFDFREADPIAALVVAVLMLRTAWSLLRDSGRVLLEGAPAGMDPDAIGRALASQPGVVEVHDLHVWEVTTDFPALAAHVMAADVRVLNRAGHVTRRLALGEAAVRRPCRHQRGATRSA